VALKRVETLIAAEPPPGRHPFRSSGGRPFEDFGLFDARRSTARGLLQELVMVSTGQTAFLVMVVGAMISLPLALLWVVIYTHLGDRKDAALARRPSAKVVDFGAQHARPHDTHRMAS
jgi:hypothetical protein